MIRVSLTEIDFEALVNGEMVEQNGVQIILHDIGFVLMERIVKQARLRRGL